MDLPPELESIETTTPQKKANLVLLTGYLGSGKTTLVSYILKEQKQYKVAVIQNEFSDEMGIEAPLMQDSEGQPFDKFYELPNGCICCSAKDDLLIAIDFLIQNEKYKLDFILVETNGLADPSQTITNFWVDDDYQYPAELRSIHTVVPTHRFEELKKNEIFIRQLIFADTILVNQVDRCKPEEIEKVEKELKLLNPIAKLKQTSYCQIDLNEIFEIDGFSVKQEKMDFVKQMENLSLDSHVHPDSAIECHFIQFEKEFDFKEAETKIGTLAWECGEDKDFDIHRMKGILNVKNDDNCMYALQGVEEIFEIKKSDVKWKPEEKKINKLLFVCEKISKEQLIKILTE